MISIVTLMLLSQIFLFRFGKGYTSFLGNVWKEVEWIAQMIKASLDLIVLDYVICNRLTPLSQKGVVSLYIRVTIMYLYAYFDAFISFRRWGFTWLTPTFIVIPKISLSRFRIKKAAEICIWLRVTPNIWPLKRIITDLTLRKTNFILKH